LQIADDVGGTSGKGGKELAPARAVNTFFDIFKRREYTLSVMRRSLVILLAAGAAMFASPALAHHSFSATYLETQTQTIEGEIVQFVFRNPHSFVHVNVKEKDGSVTVYNVEWGGTGQLNNTGVTRETLKAGDVVIISGAPGRNAADHRIRMVTLKRPKDGFTWGQAPGQTVD